MSRLTTPPNNMPDTGTLPHTGQAPDRRRLPWPLSLVETGDGELPLAVGPLLTGALAFSAGVLALIVLDHAWGIRLAALVAGAWAVFNLTLLPRIWNRSALLVVALAALSLVLPRHHHVGVAHHLNRSLAHHTGRHHR